MVKQFVVIGLGSFGSYVLMKLAKMTDQIVIVDKDRPRVERYKDLAAKSYIVDAIDPAALARVVPERVDAAIVDVGDNLEAAIMVTHELKRLEARKIIVRADTEERGEILYLMGATKVVYPAREAANELVPMLVSSSLFSYMAISPSLVLAEIKTPDEYHGRTLVESSLRKDRGINVVAVRKEDSDDYSYFDPLYRLSADDVLLCAGTERDITAFTGVRPSAEKKGLKDLLKNVFSRPFPKRKPGAAGDAAASAAGSARDKKADE